MDEKDWAGVLAILAITMWWLEARRITKMQREIDLIVIGDLETLKLKRKLDGYREAPADD